MSLDWLSSKLGVDLTPTQTGETGQAVRDMVRPGARFSIFGAGGAGQTLAVWARSRGAIIQCFFDNNPALHGTSIKNTPVLKPDATHLADAPPVLVASMYAPEICRQLTELGLTTFRDFFNFPVVFLEENVMGSGYNAETEHFIEQNSQAIQQIWDSFNDDASRHRYLRYLYLRLYYLTPERWRPGFFDDAPRKPMVHDRADQLKASLSSPVAASFEHITNEGFYQYHGKESIQVLEGDVVVDAGAWLGDTALDFALHTGSDGKVYAFEPDSDHCQSLINMKCSLGLHQIRVETAGLWSQSGPLKFSPSPDTMGSGSHAGQGSETIEAFALDDFFGDRQVHFIKMDIEGSETRALQGATHILKRDRPRLAICLYHGLDDLIQIPRMLAELVPDYRFYFDHRGRNPTDAILFATV